MKMLVVTEKSGTKHCVSFVQLAGDLVRFNCLPNGPVELPASEVDVGFEEREPADLGCAIDPPVAAEAEESESAEPGV